MNDQGYATGIPQPGNTVQASARLDTAVSDLVDRVAKRRGWTRSQTLRHVIVMGLGVVEKEDRA